jgi:hypothetical protein
MILPPIVLVPELHGNPLSLVQPLTYLVRVCKNAVRENG